MLPKIDLTNKCGSCCNFKAIGGTTQGECLQNPYGEDVVHDPEHPYWIVQRSRIKCRLYNTRPQTNADRIRARLEKDEELADLRICYNPDTDMYDTDAGSFTDFVSAMEAELEWLRQPAKEDENE